MGNVQCPCSDIINHIYSERKYKIDITELADPYDIQKILVIQGNFRRFLKIKASKLKCIKLESFSQNSSVSKKSVKEGNISIRDVTNDNPQYSKRNDPTSQPTPLGDKSDKLLNYFDEKYCPGHVFEMETVVLPFQVQKTELSLGEFIIEEKELLRYFESYSFKLQQFQLEYLNGSKYNGYYGPEWTKEGFGILIHADGTKYEGMFKNNLFEGRGRLILCKGDYYEGEFSHDKANGYGKYVNIDGDIYIGYWLNDKQHGRGELLFNDGSRYEGMFANGVRSGKGKLSRPDTSFYEGDFVNNCYEGHGLYYMRNGEIFKGEWKNSSMEGIGILIWPDGEKYIGTYHLDKENGYGTYITKDGKKYEGKFKNGKKHGIGIITKGNDTQLYLYQKGKKIKWLNKDDFKDDIDKIKKGIKAIYAQIDSNEFFNEDYDYSLSYNQKSKTNTNFKSYSSITSDS